MTNIIMMKAVKALAPDLDFRIENGDIDTIQSLNGAAIPSKKDIEDKIKVIEADEITNAAHAVAAKEAAQAKLAALGLTTDDLKALGL
jgi:hypothetical protein